MGGERWRAAVRAQHHRNMKWLTSKYPWLDGYDIWPPQRRWHAVHKATGTVIGPAKHIMALEQAIRVHYQSQPLRPRPVPLPLPERGEDEELTRFDILGWPYADRPRRDAS